MIGCRVNKIMVFEQQSGTEVRKIVPIVIASESTHCLKINLKDVQTFP